MDIKTNYLDKLKSDQTLVEIYTDNYGESDLGFILDFNDDFLLLETFGDDCDYNGLIIFFRHNITRIRWGGNEISSNASLIDSTKRLTSKPSIDLTSVESIIRSSYKVYGHITVHIQDIDKDICFIGQIHEMDDASIVIHEFGTKISLDRKFILLSLDDITKIDVGGQYERKLEKLLLGKE